MALLTWEQFRAAAPDKTQQVLNHMWVIKGQSPDNQLYVMEVDPATGGIPFQFAADLGPGPSTANTLRTASNIYGSGGEILDMNAGATSANTLRVVLATGGAGISFSADQNWGVVGANTLRAAAELGNESGLADFGTGVVSGQTVRTTLVTDVDVPIRPLSDATDSVSAVQSGAWTVGITGTVPLPTGAATAANQATEITSLGNIDTSTAAINTKTPALGQALMAASVPVVIASNQTALPVTISGGALDFGALAAAQRVAAIPGNVSGIADFNAGTTGAQTPRVSANLAIAGVAPDIGVGTSGTNTLRTVIDTRSEAVATPLATRTSNGSAFQGFDFGSSTAAARVAAQIGNATGAADFNAGAAGAQTQRVVLATGGASVISQSGGYITSTRTDFSSVILSVSTWTQLVASTSGAVNQLTIFMSSGVTLELGVGAAAAETRTLLIGPGGFDAVIPLFIPSGTRISVRAVDSVPPNGFLLINYLA